VKKHISKEQVEHISWLARLKLSEEEKELYTQQFNDILEHFNKINELNTENVPPTFHTANLTNILRDDKSKPPLPVEEALRNAPKKRKNYFQAPRML
jgi:aspartyl-tRNA(Asn)/glutamyl-tRNA(Gln) amidotransferase subunit C